MKNITTICTHMITWGMVLFLAQTSADNVMQLFLFAVGNAMLAGLCFLIRLKVKKIGWFLLCHVTCMAGCIYLVGVMYGKGVFAFLYVLTVFWSLILRVLPAAAWLENPSGIYVGALVVIYFIHWIYKAPQGVKTATVVATVVLFLLKQLYQNLDAADKFVDLRTMSTKINTKSVKSLSKQLSLIYVGMLGGILGILGVIGAEDVWNMLFKMGDKILRFIVSLIPEGEKPVYEKTFGTVNNGGAGGLDALAKESPIMQKIGEIFAFVGGIAIAVALLFLLIRGLVLLYRYFVSTKAETEEELVREKLYVGKEKSKVRKGRIFQRFEQNPTKKVRRIYKRNMQKLDQVDIRQFPYLNPEEQVEKLGSYKVEKETREEIKEIYERARYSTEKVSDADVKRMQTIM